MENGKLRGEIENWKSNMFLLKREMGNRNFKLVRFLLKRNLFFSAAIITFFENVVHENKGDLPTISSKREGDLPFSLFQYLSN